MQYRKLKAGTTDVSVILRVVDSADGTPETGVAYNTAGIDLQYRREGAASTAITEATQTASGAHSDGGFVHIGNGYCRLDLPDAACASGVSGVLVHGTITDMIVIGAYIDLEANDIADVYSRLGAPAGASVSADVAAVKAETASILTDTAEIGAAGAGLTALASQASVNTIDDFLDTEIAAILADTNELQTDWANGGRLDLILDARASQASVDTIDDIVDDILVDTGTTLPATLATIGGYLDTEVAAILAAVDTEVAAIKAKTDSLTFTVAGEIDANVQSINGTTVIGDGSTTPWGPA